MDAIKKKMQAMKLEKDNAMDRALLCEQQARDANLRAEKAEEEARSLQKKIQQIENDLDQTMEQLMQVNAKLDEKDKALQNVGETEAGFIGRTGMRLNGPNPDSCQSLLKDQTVPSYYSCERFMDEE
ncbi:hypothetical protein Cfor_05939 [Coptotermes formosanus]|uniref:Tropomyosin n=1 Tax=Coptotermes formosanus TaxID=36987 RepID=A0A6L2Q6T2_COPFO|nr:hypothetical protein Cfor_05939 [Coptotermes formosanus]